MKKQTELKYEVGDANYVAPGKLFGVLDSNNELTAIQIREDDLTMKTIVGALADIEENKEVTIDLDEAAIGTPIEITPTDGKDGMAKVTITISTTTTAKNA